MNWLDWALLAILALGVMSGFWRGFWGGWLRVGAFFLAAWAAGQLWAEGLELAERWGALDRVSPVLGKVLAPAGGQGAGGPGWAQGLGLPGPLAGLVETRAVRWLGSGGAAAAGALGLALARLLLAAAVALVVYLVARALAELAVGLLSRVLRHLPGGLVLRPVGAVLGVAEAVLSLLLVVALLAPLLALPGAATVTTALLQARWGGYLMSWSAGLWSGLLGPLGLP